MATMGEPWQGFGHRFIGRNYSGERQKALERVAMLGIGDETGKG